MPARFRPYRRLGPLDRPLNMKKAAAKIPIETRLEKLTFLAGTRSLGAVGSARAREGGHIMGARHHTVWQCGPGRDASFPQLRPTLAQVGLTTAAASSSSAADAPASPRQASVSHDLGKAGFTLDAGLDPWDLVGTSCSVPNEIWGRSHRWIHPLHGRGLPRLFQVRGQQQEARRRRRR